MVLRIASLFLVNGKRSYPSCLHQERCISKEIIVFIGDSAIFLHCNELHGILQVALSASSLVTAKTTKGPKITHHVYFDISIGGGKLHVYDKCWSIRNHFICTFTDCLC